MAYQIEVQLDAPVDLEPTVAEVELAGGGASRILLLDGRARADLPAPARRIRVLSNRASGAVPTGLSQPDLSGSPATPIDVDDLMEVGAPVPPDGKVHLEVRWGAPCVASVDGTAQTRFSGWEHKECGAKVGLGADGNALCLPNGEIFPWNPSEKYEVGASVLTFGEIIALAGDFYAYLDDQAKTEFADAWPPLKGLVKHLANKDYGTTLAGDSRDGVSDVKASIVRDGSMKSDTWKSVWDLGAAVVGEFPGLRFAALASVNYCHFNCPRAGVGPDAAENLALYRRYHARALKQAKAAGWDNVRLRSALVVDAFGCHFLTDAFAAGHMRVPRRLLAKLGLLVGSLGMSRRMHEEDNELGLWCRPRGGSDAVVWKAYGDGKLMKPEAREHLEKVREAVRCSVAEVFAAARGAEVPTVLAEDLVPIPLAPGTAPGASERVLALPGQIAVNAYPMFWFDDSDAIMVRVGGPNENAYRPYDAATGACLALGFTS